MSTGSREDFECVFHPQAVNREAAAEPPATRQPGPAGFYATAQWLRSAFSNLRFEIHETAEHDDLVVLHATMSARHTGDFVTYQPDATVDATMPPTGKAFAVTQTHWFRVRDDMIIEHWANRDDLAMARQAGWVAPVTEVSAACGTRQTAREEALSVT